jgi:hypothetical protein
MNFKTFAKVACFTLLAAASSFAQKGLLQADIPFEFRVGNTVLPAGHYFLHPQASPDLMSIECVERKAGVMVLTDGVGVKKATDTGELVFNRYGSTYFLSIVESPGYPQAREVRKSSAERQIARNESTVAPVTIAFARK